MHVGHSDAFREPGGAGQQDDGRAFCICARNGIDAVQAAHAIRDAGGADSVDAGIGIGSEPGAVFTGRPDVSDGGTFDELIEREHVIAGNTEDVAHPQLVQPIDHGRPDCRVVLCRHVRPFDTVTQCFLLRVQETIVDATRQADSTESVEPITGLDLRRPPSDNYHMTTAQDTPTGTVTLARPKEVASSEHPWIYAGFIHAVRGQPVSGDLVDVVMPNGRFYGRGLYNPASK